jgi:hypothetical protein
MSSEEILDVESFRIDSVKGCGAAKHWEVRLIIGGCTYGRLVEAPDFLAALNFAVKCTKNCLRDLHERAEMSGRCSSTRENNADEAPSKSGGEP